MNTFVKYLTVFNVLLVIFNSVCLGIVSSGRVRSNNRCPIPKIKNGTVRMQANGRMSRFSCSRGFDIHGPMNIMCQMGRWKQDIPICIKSGCEPTPQRKNGWVMIDEKKQKAMLFCHDGYISAGSTVAFCDGQNWDRQIGECRQDDGNKKFCDFETSKLCEWTQDGESDFQWVRKNGWNSFEKLEFGPKHDHTIGKPLEGHYMVAEATNSRPTQNTRFWSPIYNRIDSEQACFRFFYHMYGSRMGRLRVILKPFEKDIEDIADERKYILFEQHNSQGNKWNEAFFQIEPTQGDFQIIFEATFSNSLINDIAIDDVALMSGSDCVAFLTPEPVTEEADGIFNIQSCANRCMETQSIRVNGNRTYTQDGRIIEKCDCHDECTVSDTCCTDYQLKCLESEPTESIVATSIDDMFMEKSDKVTVLIEKMTNTSQNMLKISSTTPKSTSILASITTSTSIRTSTLNTTTAITTSMLKTTTKTTPKSTPKPTQKQTLKPSQNSTLKPTLKSTPKPTPTPKLTTTPASTSTQIPTKSYNFTLSPKAPIKPSTNSTWTRPTQSEPKKPIVTTTAKMTSTTPKFTMKTVGPRKSSLMTTKPTKSMAAPRTIQTTRKAVSRSNKMITTKTSRRTVSLTSSLSTSVIPTSTDATLNVMLMPSDTTQVTNLYTIIAICILLTLTLIGWKCFNTTKWNQFNSHQIEYKSNYNSEGTEESLIRSDSFIINDSFNDTLIDGCDVNEDAPCNPVKAEQLKTKPKKPQAEKSNTKKQNVNRIKKNCDEYSERRCLTADDEAFDFTLQTTL